MKLPEAPGEHDPAGQKLHALLNLQQLQKAPHPDTHVKTICLSMWVGGSAGEGGRHVEEP